MASDTQDRTGTVFLVMGGNYGSEGKGEFHALLHKALRGAPRGPGPEARMPGTVSPPNTATSRCVKSRRPGL